MIKKKSLLTMPFPEATDGFLRRTLGFAGVIAGLSAMALSGFAEEEPTPSFSEDFESYYDWSGLDSSWYQTDTSSGYVYVHTDQSNWFEQGTENLILSVNKVESNPAQGFGILGGFSHEVGKLSFDFYQPAGNGDEAIWLFLYAGSRHNDNRVQYIDIGTNGNTLGARTEYDRNTPNHVEFVFNNGDTPIRYGDGDYVLIQGTTDIWLNGELVETGFSRHNNKRGPVTGFELNSRSSAAHQFYFDNFVVEGVEWTEDSGVIVAPHAEVIFHEDFAAHQSGQIPGEPWTSVTDNPDTEGSALIQKDAENLFGKGSDNQYLDYIAKGDGKAITVLTENSFSSELITFSLQFIDADDDDPTYSWIILHSGSKVSTNNRVQLFTLDSDDGIGTISNGNYPLNVPNQLDFVVNNSPFSYEYGNGHTIESGTADIWINGVLARAGHSSNNNKLGPITTFEFTVGSTRKKHLLIDEITIWNSAHVSEASSPSGGFADWRTSYFPEDSDNDEISGPEANPSGDGINNLIKYALGLDPTIASRDGLPISKIREIDGEEYLTLTLTRSTERDDYSSGVVASNDLTTWENAVLVEAVDNGNGTVTETWRDVEPLNSARSRFLQLEVSLD